MIHAKNFKPQRGGTRFFNQVFYNMCVTFCQDPSNLLDCLCVIQADKDKYQHIDLWQRRKQMQISKSGTHCDGHEFRCWVIPIFNHDESSRVLWIQQPEIVDSYGTRYHLLQRFKLRSAFRNTRTGKLQTKLNGHRKDVQELVLHSAKFSRRTNGLLRFSQEATQALEDQR